MQNTNERVLVSAHVSADLHERVRKSAIKNDRTIAQELRHVLARTYTDAPVIERR